MVILCIGDVIGSAGRDALARVLPDLVRRHSIDFVIANGENLAHGVGITPSTAEALFACGVDVITGGNHTWDRREADELLRTNPRVLRPANYPATNSGHGAGVFPARSGGRVGVINLQGRVFMPETDDPFRTADRLVDELTGETRVLVVDFHAEATSEKTALAWHLEGRVSIFFGTHTHIATDDARVLPAGTAYISDVGMTGGYDSVIGVDKRAAIDRFLTSTPQRLEPAPGDPRVSALLVEVDPESGRAAWCRRLEIAVSEGGESACHLLYGAPVAERVEKAAGERALRLRALGVTPKLALLSVGDDPASRIYLGRKKAAAERAGVEVFERRWEKTESPAAVLRGLAEVGGDSQIHGMLLQLPLPAGWDPNAFLAAIPPEKDVDGFHPVNAGRLALGLPGFVPCTPLGIRELLRYYRVPLRGRRVVVLGRSSVVGRPLANLLSAKGEDATVTLAHSQSRDLPGITREADVLVVAIGKAEAIGGEYVRPGATVIDVGIHRVPDHSRPGASRLVGDVHAESVRAVASGLSPVPGGVGPLTVAFLLDNLLQAAERAGASTHSGAGVPPTQVHPS
jgi:metallophosphoesterase (TIGR00282 family)